MALFKRDKDTADATQESAAQKPAPADAPQASAPRVLGTADGVDLSRVLRRPHITEKASDLAAHNAYAFRIDPRANKHQVAEAVKQIYGLSPVKVRIVRRAPRMFRSRMRGGTKGMHAGYKKAYVYLKEGDRIEFV